MLQKVRKQGYIPTYIPIYFYVCIMSTQISINLHICSHGDTDAPHTHIHTRTHTLPSDQIKILHCPYCLLLLLLVTVTVLADGSSQELSQLVHDVRIITRQMLQHRGGEPSTNYSEFETVA